MRKKSLFSNRNTKITFLITFFTLLFIMWCSPLSSDDYEFAGQHFQNIKEMIQYVLYYGNGRFLGNLGVIVLLHSPLLKIIIKSAILTGIVILIPKILGVETKESYLLSFLLILGISPVFFAQVYQWTSGFQNYAPPVFLLLLCIYVWKNYDPIRQTTKQSTLKITVLFLSGFASQLFVENSTVANLLTAGACMLYALKKKNGKQAASIMWFLSTALGGFVMFMLPKIFYIAGNRGAGYRSVEIGGTIEFISSAIGNSIIILKLFSDNAVLFILLSIFTYLVLEHTKGNWENTVYPFFIRYFLILFICYELCLLLYRESWSKYIMTEYIISAIFLLIFICSVISVIWHMGEEQVRHRLFTLFGAAVIFTGPLLLVNPIAERCLFLPYIFIVMGAITMLHFCIKTRLFKSRITIIKTLTFASAFLICFLVVTFGDIRWEEKQMDTYITKQMENGARKIDVPDFPTDYVHPKRPWALQRYYYYKEWDDISFTVVDFDEWWKERIAEKQEEEGL